MSTFRITIAGALAATSIWAAGPMSGDARRGEKNRKASNFTRKFSQKSEEIRWRRCCRRRIAGDCLLETKTSGRGSVGRLLKLYNWPAA